MVWSNIPHNSIHQILLENGLAIENKKRVPRYFPWVNAMIHEAFVTLCLCGDRCATGYHKDTKEICV